MVEDFFFQNYGTDKVFGHETTGLYSEKKYPEDYINYFSNKNIKI